MSAVRDKMCRSATTDRSLGARTHGTNPPACFRIWPGAVISASLMRQRGKSYERLKICT